MNTTGLARRCLAVALSAALVAALIPTSVQAADDLGTLNGRVFDAHSRAPLAGAVIKAAHLPTEEVFESVATGADGKFHLTELPPGAYELAVATDEGLYPTGRVLTLDRSRTSTIALALAPGQNDPAAEGENEGEGEKKKKGGSFWDKPVFAALTIVGVALVLGLAANELLGKNDSPAEIITSPSAGG
jgi:hypothetical protein